MLGLINLGRSDPVMVGQKVMLRMPRPRDHAQWATLRRESRAFLEPWEPRWAEDELSLAAWRQRLRRYRSDFRQGTGLAFFVFDIASGNLAGGINVSNIRHGVSQSGSVGYWMGEQFAGRGLMAEALGLVVHHCFGALRLHRLEAACIPQNERSMRVLEKAGFRREGLLHAYLKINGHWQDHFLYALVADEAAGTRRGPLT
jgi:ribosomal-protein-alanine N-acetyltransferase